MPRRNRQPFTRHDTFISFDLKVGNQRGKRLLKKIVDAISEEHSITTSIIQGEALKLILLNAVYFNYKPLIISLNNNSYKINSRYNHSGVGITAFKSIYKKLKSKRLIHLRFASVASPNAPESTVIEVDRLRRYCLPYEAQLKKYLYIKTELIILRKTIRKYGWQGDKLGSQRNTIPCEYTDTDFSHSARRFLKDYNSWIAIPTITFNYRLAIDTGLFRMPRYQHYAPDDIKAYIFTYFHNRALRRIFIAPEDYVPNEPQSLPKLGGRFYGSFWQDAMPSDFRRYLEIDGKPCVELDFRAMNVTMLYLKHLKRPWDSYPYEDIPVPTNPEIVFPKALVKPFFTWCLNVKTRKSAYNLLRHRLPEELEYDNENKNFLRENEVSYVDYVSAILADQPTVIADQFFTGEIVGRRLQFYDSEILERIMRQCMEAEIYCFPIHDALLVQEQHKDQVKDLMVRTLCEYFKAEFKPEYVELLVKEEKAPERQ